jgi:hypothetical protein
MKSIFMFTALALVSSINAVASNADLKCKGNNGAKIYTLDLAFHESVDLTRLSKARLKSLLKGKQIPSTDGGSAWEVMIPVSVGLSSQIGEAMPRTVLKISGHAFQTDVVRELVNRKIGLSITLFLDELEETSVSFQDESGKRINLRMACEEVAPL